MEGSVDSEGSLSPDLESQVSVRLDLRLESRSVNDRYDGTRLMTFEGFFVVILSLLLECLNSTDRLYYIQTRIES